MENALGTIELFEYCSWQFLLQEKLLQEFERQEKLQKDADCQSGAGLVNSKGSSVVGQAGMDKTESATQENPINFMMSGNSGGDGPRKQSHLTSHKSTANGKIFNFNQSKPCWSTTHKFESEMGFSWSKLKRTRAYFTYQAAEILLLSQWNQSMSSLACSGWSPSLIRTCVLPHSMCIMCRFRQIYNLQETL